MSAYGFYLKEQSQKYKKIEKGFCPKCKHKSIELVDIRGSGCMPKLLTFRCGSCGYEESFTQKENSCSL